MKVLRHINRRTGEVEMTVVIVPSLRQRFGLWLKRRGLGVKPPSSSASDGGQTPPGEINAQ